MVQRSACGNAFNDTETLLMTFLTLKSLTRKNIIIKFVKKKCSSLLIFVRIPFKYFSIFVNMFFLSENEEETMCVQFWDSCI